MCWLCAIRFGGIDRRHASAEGVDPAHFKERRGIRYPFPARPGKSFDEMTEYLRQFGYVQTTGELHDKLFRALSGEQILTPEAQMAQLDRMSEEDQAAEALDSWDTINAELAAEFNAELTAEFTDTASLAAEDKLISEWVVKAQNAGASDTQISDIVDWVHPESAVIAQLQELIDGQTSARHTSDHEASRVATQTWNEENTRASGARPGRTETTIESRDPGESFALNAYSETDLSAREQSLQTAHERQLKQAEAAEQKHSADAELSNFTLTGSDRSADITAAQGQGDIFATQPPGPAPYGAQNTRVSADRAAELRNRLKQKLKQLNSGIDPEMMAIGTELAVFHIEAGARRFSALAHAMARDLDTSIDKIRPYLRSWYNGARDMMEDSGLDVSDMYNPDQVRTALKTLSDNEVQDAQYTATDTESNRGNRLDEKSGAATGLRDGGRGSGGHQADGNSRPADDGGHEPATSLGDSRTDADRERGDQSVPRKQSRVGDGATGSADHSGSSENSTGGLLADKGPGRAAERVIEQAPVTAKATLPAPGRITAANLSQIKSQLPFLTDGQAEDVVFAEKRFNKPDGFGVLFTNGTGTGKTFTGLGAIYQAFHSGKKNILIVAPKQPVVDAWIKAGKSFFNLDIHRLKSKRDNGKRGIAVTSFANLGENATLLERQRELSHQGRWTVTLIMIAGLC
ncbi:MAG: DEAD/DEAH box helicase family protein [Marinobacterium sp.]|nr:DEAD/DEAH box helicase family protein [Marinobacterium sp.]